MAVTTNLRQLTIRQLHEVTGKSERTVKKALAHLEPAREDSRARYYDPHLALPLIFGLEGGKLDPGREKALLDQARRRKVDLELAVMEARLIDGETVSRSYEDECATVRARILAVASQVAPLIHAATPEGNVGKYRDIVDKGNREALEALGRGLGLGKGTRRAPAAAGKNGQRVGGRGKVAQSGNKRGTGEVAD